MSAFDTVEHSFQHPLGEVDELGFNASEAEVPKEKVAHHHTDKKEMEMFEDEFLFKNHDERSANRAEGGNSAAVDDLFGGKRTDAVFGPSTFHITEAPVTKKSIAPTEPTGKRASVGGGVDGKVEVEVKVASNGKGHHADEEQEEEVKVEEALESFPTPMTDREAKRAALKKNSLSLDKGKAKSGFSFASLSSRLSSSSSSPSSSSSSSSSSEHTETSEGQDEDRVYDISIPITHIEEHADEESYAVYHVEFFCLSSTEPKTVVKRFSQFHNLHEALRQSFPEEEMPSFPTRIVLGSSLEPKLIDERQKLLDRYLKELLLKKRLWCSFHVKLFFGLYDLTGKVAIVTGASSGVGFQTALALARLKAHVILACRSRDKTEPIVARIKQETNNETVEFAELDLASLDSVRHFAAAFTKRGLPLHFLINNAGVAGAMGQLTQDGFEIHMGVNYIGHFLLTNLLLDDLHTTATKSGAASRIVNVASRAHMDARDLFMDDGYMFNPTTKVSLYPAFAQSKLALVTFTNELNQRLAGMNVVANSVHPGSVATDTFFKQAWNPIPFSVNWLSKKFLISEEEGARCTLFAALAEVTGSVCGRYFENCTEKAPNHVSHSRTLMTQLWEHSEAWTGLAE